MPERGIYIYYTPLTPTGSSRALRVVTSEYSQSRSAGVLPRIVVVARTWRERGGMGRVRAARVAPFPDGQHRARHPRKAVYRQISRPCAHAARQKRHHAASWRPCTPPWRTCAEPAFPARSRRPCVLLASLATPAHRPLLNGRPAPRNGERHCRASEAHARRAALPPTGRAARGRIRKGGG